LGFPSHRAVFAECQFIRWCFAPDGSAYDVMVSDDIGARHTILGFKTEAAAQEWIVEDRCTTARAEPERDR
jgi:hypothetical protein